MVENLLYFIILFLIVFAVYYLFLLRTPKTLEKMKNGKELYFLRRNYHLDYNKLNLKSVCTVVALANSFIVSFTTIMVCLLNEWIDNFYLWLIACLFMAIVIFFPLIIILYHFIGSHFNKKQKEMK